MPENEPTRLAESKVVPPPRTDIKYPDVASIPPGSHSVVVIPKTKEIELPIKEDLPSGDGVKTIVKIPLQK